MLGNAVTPSAARDLVAAIAEAITGETLDLLGWPIAGTAHLDQPAELRNVA